MKIRRAELVDVVDQKTVRQVTVNVEVQLISIRIDETRAKTQKRNEPQRLQPAASLCGLQRLDRPSGSELAYVAQRSGEEVNAQQDESKHESTMHVCPDNSEDWQPE